MKLIVGLGNPGEEYKNSRHNAGFLFVEKMANGAGFSIDKKFEAEVCKSSNFLFVKPQTFMNESGRSVRKIMDFYKLTTDDVVLVHDDLDLKLGDYKIQKGIGPKVHNGVSSVETNLPDKNFLRVRLGIDNRDSDNFFGGGADYVLGKLSKAEQEILDDSIEEAADELLVALGLEVE